jgi:PPOX class probable F420-dependent enzyme
MPDLNDVRSFLSQETGLATVSTTQADGRVLSSIVNCGVFDHPLTGETSVALVARGAAARVGHVRRGSEVTIAVRRGWSWVGVTGPASLIGPDDIPTGMTDDDVRILLRDIYSAAGGVHDDWDEYDRAMAEDGRIAIFVSPDRILGNIPTA